VSQSFSRPPPPRAAAAEESAVVDRRVVVDGIDTQYLEAGCGPVLVLLHRHKQNAASWRWVMPAWPDHVG
jgi:hypothetical protein